MREPLPLTFSSLNHKRPPADVLVVPYHQVKWGEEKLLQDEIRLAQFKGAPGETLFLISSKIPEKRILIIGAKGGKEGARAYGAKLALICREKKLEYINFILPKKYGKEAVEGFLSLAYTFDLYKTEKPKGIKKGCCITDEKVDIMHLHALFKGVYLARDLINGNADDVTAEKLVKAAKEIGKTPHVRVTCHDKKWLEKEGFGLLLAVNRGSIHDPALILGEWKGDPKNKKHTVIVGKGVTYDTGGLNLKTDMLTMKADMSGAALCLGLLQAAAETKLKANFTIVIPVVENGIDARSYKPGDVYRSYSGKTVEIGNTDAEGRLILADALSYAVKHLKPTQIIDFATLTGAMVVALGHEIAGFFSTDEKLKKALIEAGEQVEEKVWPLPLMEEYKKKLKSDIADLVNVAGRDAGAIKAALFLQEFVEDIPWAHVDIAGVAFRPEIGATTPKHGIGFGVRLMMEFLSS